MLSCAAVQKLERYGQLGLKRNGVEDFVLASLKDPKRASVYALTHTATWQECLDAIHRSIGGQASTDAAAQHSRAPVTVTDSLVYAVSFATALVAHHLFQEQVQQHHRSRKLDTHVEAVFDASEGVQLSPNARAAALVALLKHIVVRIAREGNRSTHHGGGTGGDDIGNGGVCIAETKELVQALMHLLGNVSVMLFYALSVRLNNLASDEVSTRDKQSSEADNSTDTERNSVIAVWRDGLVLLAAAARLLRRTSVAQNAAKSDEPLFTTRTATALVKQFIHRHQQQRGSSKGAAGSTAAPRPTELRQDSSMLCAEAMHRLEPYPLLQILLRYTNVLARCAAAGKPMAGNVTLFENFSVLQRLSLLNAAIVDTARLEDAMLATAIAVDCHSDATVSTQTSSRRPSASARERAVSRFVESGVQRLLRDLLAPSACNRATRYVVYFRGDDLKLIQSRVSQPSQYALHTFATTPPVDPALVETVQALSTNGSSGRVSSKITENPGDGGRSGGDEALWQEQQHAFYGIAFAQWVVSAPLFFEAFCSEPSWAVFAQEQRRAVLVQQALQRRGRREASHRRSKQQRREGAASSGGSSRAGSERGSSVDSSAHDDGDGTASTRSTASTLHDIAPSLETSRSMLSLESRASLLSTLSKQSVATYVSFLSVLQPTGGEDGNGTGSTGTHGGEPKYHESADGNTNLPLILLEELVLGLHRFMESFPAACLDCIGPRALCWQSIGRLFLSLQGSFARNRTVAATTAATTSGDGFETDGTATGQSTNTTADVPLVLFNLGADLRYNHGLGYEALGLLFAKVIAPQFEAGLGTSAHGRSPIEMAPSTTAGRASLAITDAPSTRQIVEAALSQCLAAYEAVAPQVVDSNLPAILRVAARTVAVTELGSTLRTPHAALTALLASFSSSSPSKLSIATPTSTTMGTAATATALSPTAAVLYGFLAGVVRRLGRSNQLPILLDALVTSTDTSGPKRSETVGNDEEGATTTTSKLAAEPSDSSGGGDGDSDTDVVALQVVFSHPLCRSALVEASALAMDPETVLARLLTYVSSWALTMDEGNDGSSEDADHTHDPQHVQFVLALTAAVLEGVQPTSMTSSAVLDKSAELELLLTAFAQRHLYVNRASNTKGSSHRACPQEENDQDAATPAKNSLFRGGPLKLNARHQLWLHVLYAINQCRAVTLACLRDLGLQNLRDYLVLLNDTIWRVDRHAGALLLSADADDDGEEERDSTERHVRAGRAAFSAAGGAGFTDLAAQMSATTCMSLPPYAHARTLLLRLALQRLCLVRAVTTVLDVPAEPAADVRRLAQCVLEVVHEDCSCAADGTATTATEVGSTRAAHTATSVAQRVLASADAMMDEEWTALVAYAKKKQLRATLVALLRRTFAASAGENNINAVRNAQPSVWLARCLRAQGGAALRAMTDMVLSYTTEEVVQIATPGKATSATSVTARELVAMLDALCYSYSTVGHVPYWPLLAERASAWLMALLDTTDSSATDALEATARQPKKTAEDYIKKATDSTLSKRDVRGSVLNALVRFLDCCLTYEDEAGDVLRRTLLRTEAQSPKAESDADQELSAVAVHGKAISRLFLEEVGMWTSTGGTASGAAQQQQEEEEQQDLSYELSAFSEELTALACRLFDAKACATRLLTIAAAGSNSTDIENKDRCSVNAAHIMNLHHVPAARVVAFAYHTAIITARAACREGRYHRHTVALSSCTAIRFLCDVANLFRAAMVSGDSHGAASLSETLTPFLSELGYLPAGDAALTPLLPQGRSKRSLTTASTRNSVTQPHEDVITVANAVEGVWTATLRESLAAVLDGTAHENLQPHSASVHRLTGCVALYRKLLVSTTRSCGNTAVPASRTPLAVLLVGYADGDGNSQAKRDACNNSASAMTLRDALAALFVPTPLRVSEHSAVATVLAPADATKALSRLATIAFPLTATSPLSDCRVGMITLWVLLSLHAESVHGHHNRQAAPTAVATTLVAALLSHGQAYHYAKKTRNAKHVTTVIAAAAQSFCDQMAAVGNAAGGGSGRGGRALVNAFLPSLTTAVSVPPPTEAAAFTEAALGAAVDALVLLPTAATPAALPAYIAATLTAATATAAGVLGHAPVSCGTYNDSGADWTTLNCAYELLTHVASTLLRISQLCSAAIATSTTVSAPFADLLQRHTLALLSVATTPACLVTAARLAAASNGGNTAAAPLHTCVLELLATPAMSAVTDADPTLLDAAWSFLKVILAENNRSAMVALSDRPTVLSVAEGATVAATPTSATTTTNSTEAETAVPPLTSTVARFTLSQREAMAALALLSGSWLSRETVWRRAAHLPPLVSALFEAVLTGVRDGRYARRVLGQTAHLFHLLVRLGIDAAEEAEGEAAGGHTGNWDGEGDKAPPLTRQQPAATYRTRLLCLAAAVADMFHVARHHVAVFTTYSSDLDYIARDFLRALSRVHLPQRRGTPIAFHAGVHIRPAAPSPATFADLVYTCVGDGEGRALLRQAALRLEDEVEDQGAGGIVEGLVERRHIFNVEE